MITFAQTILTLVMYAIGAVVLGTAAFVPAGLTFSVWQNTAGLEFWPRIWLLCVTAAAGYFVFGLILVLLASAVRIILRLNVKEGIYPVGSPVMIRWMMASALIIAVRFTFMEFILLTPFCALFYRLMGARLGKNVQINSGRVGDIWHLQIGDHAVIGGNATVICHAFEKDGLHIRKVRIGRKAIIGLNAVVMPGCQIGDGAVVAAGAVVPKDTVIPPGTVYYGPAKSSTQM